MFKICVWMNIPSHYQKAFFVALDARADVDLQVRYLAGVCQDRVAEGWGSEYELASFERFADASETADDLLVSVADWNDRIHVICGYFSSELIDLFSARGVHWCHWSEMPGIRLATALGFRVPLFRLFNPFTLKLKRAEGRRIETHAMGAFGQGMLARRAFRTMGVSDHKIAHLYYTPNPLDKMEPNAEVQTFAQGRNVFLAVGALCRRKGIDSLIKAFAAMDAADWCLVLCGLDAAEGEYQALAERLGIADRILFFGACAADQIAAVYAAADVFVLSSRFDGWGAVLNEAASVGLPLIGTDLCGGSWHVIDDGVNGFRVKAGSVAGLRDAMMKYAHEPELLVAHGAESKKLYFKEFTPEKNAERLVAAMKEWSE